MQWLVIWYVMTYVKTIGEPMALSKDHGVPMAHGCKTIGVAHGISGEDHGGSPWKSYMYVAWHYVVICLCILGNSLSVFL